MVGFSVNSMALHLEIADDGDSRRGPAGKIFPLPNKFLLIVRIVKSLWNDGFWSPSSIMIIASLICEILVWISCILLKR